MTNNADTITCKYLTYRYLQRFIRLPLVHIYLKAELEVQTDALVDSGSTTTFIPYEIAESIGLLPEDRRDLPQGEARAASGEFKTYIVRLPILRVMKGKRPFDEFINIAVQVPQSENISLPYVILGRDYIFKHFDITFHENRQKFTFRRL